MKPDSEVMTDQEYRCYKDGTAIDWDTECLATPLDFDAGDWALAILLGMVVVALLAAAIAVVAHP